MSDSKTKPKPKSKKKQAAAERQAQRIQVRRAAAAPRTKEELEREYALLQRKFDEACEAVERIKEKALKPASGLTYSDRMDHFAGPNSASYNKRYRSHQEAARDLQKKMSSLYEAMHPEEAKRNREITRAQRRDAIEMDCALKTLDKMIRQEAAEQRRIQNASWVQGNDSKRDSAVPSFDTLDGVVTHRSSLCAKPSPVSFELEQKLYSSDTEIVRRLSKGVILFTDQPLIFDCQHTIGKGAQQKRLPCDCKGEQLSERAQLLESQAKLVVLDAELCHQRELVEAAKLTRAVAWVPNPYGFGQKVWVNAASDEHS